MKKFYCIIACLLIVMASIFANGTAETATQKKNVTLTFGSHQSGLPNTGVVQSLAEDFEAQTGIKIDFQISPDAQWRDLIKVKLDSGEAPDIICVDTPINLISSIPVARYCAPLTDETWVSRMNASAVSAVSDQGQVYGITFPGPKMYLCIYNKQIFKNLGMTPPTTYAQFKKVCQKILDAGITPMYECTIDGWHQVLPLFETGGLYLQSDPALYEELNANTKNLSDVPQMLEIIKELDEFARLGYFGPDYLSNSYENATEAIASGRCAMFIAGMGWKDQVVSEYPDFDINNLGEFVQPWADNQVIGVNPAACAYFINKSGKHIAEAKQFFQFLSQEENLKKYFAGQPDLKELCWPEIPNRFTNEENAFLKAHKTASVVQTSVNYIDSQWMDIGKDLESMFIGASTPEEVLQTIMERRSQQAKLHHDPNWTK